MLSTLIISIVILVLLVFGILSFIKRGRKGCCSSGGEVKLENVEVDKDESHYSYRYEYSVEGMHCVHCQKRIEESLDRLGGVWARCDWQKGKLLLLGKKEVSSITVLERLEALGYKGKLIS